jgi:hypothetical protein
MKGRIMWHAIPALLLLAALACMPALAQPAPQPPRDLRPSRDVSVAYALNGGAETYMTQSWDAAGKRLRMTTTGEPGWMLIDFARGHATMIVDRTRRYITQPERSGAPDPLSLPPDARLTRVGADRVAGQACTDWRVNSVQLAATLCMTADNVMVRMIQQRSDGEARLEARSVSFARADPARFRVPDGYQEVRR